MAKLEVFTSDCLNDFLLCQTKFLACCLITEGRSFTLPFGIQTMLEWVTAILLVFEFYFFSAELFDIRYPVSFN